MSAGEPRDGACPSDDTVALFLEGGLGGADEAGFRAHLDGCPSCRTLLVEAAREAPNPLAKTGGAGRKARQLLGAIDVGETIADKYRVEAVLGSGGMGTVVRASHLVLNRTVAVKVMHPELLTEDTARRFAREARAAAALTSEHAVRILDIDRLESGVPYIVMEYLEGRDLHEVLMDDGPIPWRRAIDYVLQAAEALAEAHERGIIHRDLKPHNLFLRRDGVVKVLDFGLAKTLPHSRAHASSGETNVKGLVGSPQYMAPEQIRGESGVDARTDIYGLGATLYQLLTGIAPFLGMNVYVLCARILGEAPPPFRSRNEVPSSVETVVLRCLEKAPDARYGTMQELSAALLGARDVPAPPGKERFVTAPQTAVVPTRLSAGAGAAQDDFSTLRDSEAFTVPRGGEPSTSVITTQKGVPSMDPVTPRTEPHGEPPPPTEKTPRD